MVQIKSIKLDGEFIHVFNSAIYIFEASAGLTLEVNLIVSEVLMKKYKNVENVIIEIELEDGRIINSIMGITVLRGKLPQIHVFCELEDDHDYRDFNFVKEEDAWFPNIEEGITLEDIRKVEMPNEEITLKLTLPIDQVEWLKKQKKKALSEWLSEWIYKQRKDLEH
jgi:hypothetical protein